MYRQTLYARHIWSPAGWVIGNHGQPQGWHQWTSIGDDRRLFDPNTNHLFDIIQQCSSCVNQWKSGSNACSLMKPSSCYLLDLFETRFVIILGMIQPVGPSIVKPRPHLINIQFQRKVKVSEICIFDCFKVDESAGCTFRAGTALRRSSGFDRVRMDHILYVYIYMYTFIHIYIMVCDL